MKTYEVLMNSVIVLPAGEPIFSELATMIALEDDAAGLFVTVRQEGQNGVGKVAFCPEEWPLIREQIEKMLAVCEQRSGTQEEKP